MMKSRKTCPALSRICTILRSPRFHFHRSLCRNSTTRLPICASHAHVRPHYQLRFPTSAHRLRGSFPIFLTTSGMCSTGTANQTHCTSRFHTTTRRLFSTCKAATRTWIQCQVRTSRGLSSATQVYTQCIPYYRVSELRPLSCNEIHAVGLLITSCHFWIHPGHYPDFLHWNF